MLTAQKMIENGTELPVLLVEWTIAKSGPFKGCAAVVLYLGMAHYSSLFPVSRVIDIVQEKRPFNVTSVPLLIIKGLDTLNFNLEKLIEGMLTRCWDVHIETNGSVLTNNITLLTMWTKYRNLSISIIPTLIPVCNDIAEIAYSYEYIIYAEDVSKVDGLPIKIKSRPLISYDGEIYIRPEIVSAANVQACIESALKFNYILDLPYEI